MSTDSALVRLAATRAAADPFFLAHALHQIATRRVWTDNDLAAGLACPVDALTMLRLCRMPRHWEDVQTIATGCGCDAAKLAALLAMP
jgi:hypothetical protein